MKGVLWMDERVRKGRDGQRRNFLGGREEVGPRKRERVAGATDKKISETSRLIATF
jgi:hypothetical protein